MRPGDELNWDGIPLANNRKISESKLAGGKMAYSHSSNLSEFQSKHKKAKKVGRITQKINILILKGAAIITVGVTIFVPLHRANTELMTERGATKIETYSPTGGPTSSYILPEGIEKPAIVEIIDRALENIGEKVENMVDRFGKPTIGNQIK